MTEQIAVGQIAPDFELTDVKENAIRLSDYLGKKHVLLVFTRGFF
jgi:peroxiredoxin